MAESDLVTGAREALDAAIAEVARTNWRRLVRDQSASQRAERVEGALGALGRLPFGDRPKYDEWEALFYLTWYQPRQIHLVYSVLRRRHTSGFGRLSGPLRVVDLGCGAWVVRLASAILLAEERSSGVGRAPQVAVEGIDPSRAMRALGLELWVAFRRAAAARGLDPLVDTIDAMTGSHQYCPKNFSRVKGTEAPCWLTAVHAVYRENRHEFRRLYRRVRDTVKPCYELVTTHESKKNLLGDLVSGSRLDLRPARPRWCGVACRTSEWRRTVSAELEGPRTWVLRYLGRDVCWNDKPIDKDAVRVRVRSRAQ